MSVKSILRQVLMLCIAVLYIVNFGSLRYTNLNGLRGWGMYLVPYILVHGLPLHECLMVYLKPIHMAYLQILQYQCVAYLYKWCFRNLKLPCSHIHTYIAYFSGILRIFQFKAYPYIPCFRYPIQCLPLYVIL